MPERRPRYSKEEFRRRGEEIFHRKILPRVADEDPMRFVVIDIESEDFEVDEDSLAAADRLIAKDADCQLWIRRVGSIHSVRFGGNSAKRTFHIRKLTG